MHKKKVDIRIVGEKGSRKQRDEIGRRRIVFWKVRSWGMGFRTAVNAARKM